MKPYIVDASAVCLIHGEILTTSWKSDNCSRQLSNVSNSNIKRFFQTDLQISFLLKEAGCYGDMESLQLITVCSKNVSFTENFD